MSSTSPTTIVTEEFERALALARDGRNLFITGKAGTGKSTLLRLICSDNSAKSIAVVAPTGVAALNVEGETIHSLFAFRPVLTRALEKYRAPTCLADLDLLIVDEVSMARADLIDQMDTALRRRRRVLMPFGGVQLICIGDLHQLPPVVDDDDAILLEEYATRYFFSANAFRGTPLKTIELTRVFRQKDERFIGLLNTIRDGTATRTEINTLNRQVRPGFEPSPTDGFVTLANDNKRVDKINSQRLRDLGATVFESTAEVVGEYKMDRKAIDATLRFSVGAQVMMLINAGGYVNGSIGTIEGVMTSGSDYLVEVRLHESSELVKVRPYRWIKYRAVKRDGRVIKEEVGSLCQLPFRLAWAVTVHKSQGKTFDRVVYDRGRGAFEAGQLYVALSRCRSLEGIALARPIRMADVITDPVIKSFHRRTTTPLVDLRSTPQSYVAFASTGGGRFSKLVEFAIVRPMPDGSVLRYSTFVNPLRDLSDATEYGIDSTSIELAPTADEVRGTCAALLDGSVVVGSHLDEFNRLMGWDNSLVNVGIGVDAMHHSQEVSNDLSDSSLNRAESLFTTDLFARTAMCPASVFRRTLSAIAPGDYSIWRTTLDANALLHSLRQHAYLSPFERVLIAVGATALNPEGAGQMTLDFASREGFSTERVAQIANSVFDRLINASQRDDAISPSEIRLLEAFKAQWDIRRAIPCGTSVPAHIGLTAGMRVCFTGKIAKGSCDEHLSKDYLRSIAAELDLVETESVTISGCDLVVAADRRSLSKKAKTARQHGVPVLTYKQFVELAASRRNSLNGGP